MSLLDRLVAPNESAPDLERGFRPRPRAPWEAYLAIAIGPIGSPVRFAKTHSLRTTGRHPLSALEGLTAREETRTFVATAERVVEWREERASFPPFPATGPIARAGDGGSLALRPEPTCGLTWVKSAPLVYRGWFGPAHGEVHLDGKPPASLAGGLAVVEHAFGGDLPFDPRLLIRGRWHWDVLALPASEFAAGLWIPLPALGTRGLRAGGSPDLGPLRAARHEILDGDGRVPRRWRGELSSRNGPLRYEAVATTPALEVAPRVFFLGFDAELDGVRTGSARGFAECGGPP